MEVEAAVETPLVYAGDKIKLSVTFIPPTTPFSGPAPILLSGYAVVQGSFKLGDMLLSEPFADTRKQGIVLTRRGIEYGKPQSSGSLFAGVLDGLKHLVVTGASDRRPGDSSTSSSAPGSSGNAMAGTIRNGSSSSGHDEGDYPVFATSQLLLFSDLKLTKREKFELLVDLPRELPPTYRSRSLQITYSLVVGFERIRLSADSKPLDPTPVDTRLFLPFRLLAKPPTPADPHPPKFDLRHPINAPPPTLVSGPQLDDDADAGDETITETATPTPEAVAPLEATPGSVPESSEMTEFIDNLLADGKNTEAIAAQRNRSSSLAHLPGAQYTKVSYDISKNKVKIAQLVLAKPATFVGDVLAAQIKIIRPCLHISVFLELEEQIEEPYAALTNAPLRSSNSGNGSAGNGNNTNESEPEISTAYTIYARQFQGVYGLKELPVYLPTLTSITPRLDTEQMTSSWSLRIEFVGLTGSAFALEEDNGLLAKGQVDHEVFTCRIPVVILPSSMGGHSVAKTWKF